MAQTIRLTITPEIEKALQILRRDTSGTLNTTELIKMTLGEAARQKEVRRVQADNADSADNEISPEEWDRLSARQFYEWAKEDGSLEVDNIAHPERLKPFVPKPYVRTR